MSDEQDKLKLSLEAPKLFGRKKKADTAGDGAVDPAADTAKPARTTGRKPAAKAATSDDSAAAAADEPEHPVVDESEVEEPTLTLDAAEPVAEPEPEPEPVAEPEPEPEPVAKAAPAKKTPAPKPAKPAKAAKPEPVAVTPEPATSSDPVAGDSADTADVAKPSEGPLLTMYRAAALTGLVVGASMVVLTWLALRGCEAVRDTSSCGGGPGFLLLVAIFVVCVLLGSALLKAFAIPDSGSSSFLAVGLVAVVALLFLIDFLDSWAMLVVIPALSVGGYLASAWVTKTFVDDETG